MKFEWGLAVPLITAAIILALLIASTGCSELPSMKYCDQVTYIRHGNVISVSAECRAPVGVSATGL